MGFNYAKEKRRFDVEWLVKFEEYRAAGFNESGIQAIRDYDWEVFCQRRTYENRTQDFPNEVFDADEEDSGSTLFRKFRSLTSSFDENAFSGRYDWIDAIDNPAFVEKLKKLSDSDKELLTLLAFDGYTQTEIAVMQGVTRVVICKKVKRIKKFLKQG